MQDVIIESFETTSGVKYVYFRSKTGYFCISRNAKVFYKGGSMEGAAKQLQSLKDFLKRANHIKEGGENNGATATINRSK